MPHDMMESKQIHQHASDTIAIKFSCLNLSGEHHCSHLPMTSTSKECTLKLSLLIHQPYTSYHKHKRFVQYFIQYFIHVT